MDRRHLYIAISVSCAVVAVIGCFALFEHWAGLKGSEWLEQIFPFGLAVDPLNLVALTATAALLSWLFHRLAQSH